ncbi:MAG: ATP-binding protein [Bacteroidales bacterium]|jgi:two-component system OmpR family sensor kinase|nr:ATP-binding protein [Bacteroidales bacterium]
MRKKNRQIRETLMFVLLLSVIWIAATVFVFFRYSSEKRFKEDMMNASLQSVNEHVAEILGDGNNYHFVPQDDRFFSSLDSSFKDIKRIYPDIRITIIESNGKVIYDSYEGAKSAQMQNHSSRPEFRDAMKSGNGFIVRRLSKTTSENYFYSATKIEHNLSIGKKIISAPYIVRSALPYSVSLQKTLSLGHSFVWFIAGMTLLLSLMAVLVIGRIRKDSEEIEYQHNKAMREEEEKIRIKKQLTNNINHELKTPVSGISLCLETMLRNPNMTEEQKHDFLAKSYSETQRLSSLLQDVSTITRMDEAPDMIKKERLYLSNIIREEVAAANQMIISRQHTAAGTSLNSDSSDNIPGSDKSAMIKIHLVNLESKPLVMYGNDSLLRSIFSNLLNNAISYSSGTEIYIKLVKETPDKYFFSLWDNGVGVDSEHLPHLFERFYRVDKGRSRKAGGTGLGLSIVKNAVIIHGGTITVNNYVPSGLQFDFSFKKQ